MNSAIPLDKLLARFEIRGQLKVLFLEPFARSEPEKSNPATQGKDDVQKTRTLERGPRFEAPLQKCVMGTPNSAQTWPEHHRSTSGISGCRRRGAKGFEVLGRRLGQTPRRLVVRSCGPVVRVEGLEISGCRKKSRQRLRSFGAPPGPDPASFGRAAPSCGAEGFDVWDAADVPPMTTAPSSIPWGTEGSNYLAKTAQEKHRGFAKNKKRRGYRSFFINLGDGGFVFVCRIGPETHGGFEKNNKLGKPIFSNP